MINLVEISDPHFIIDLMYAREENMSGRALYHEVGFGNRAYLHPDAAAALMLVIPELERLKLKMRICDAYRPAEAHRLLVKAVPIPGFFKPDYRTSNHCHGTAVDVCLADWQGRNMCYPTEVDGFDPKWQREVSTGKFDGFRAHLQKARHDYLFATQEEMRNRAFLKELMESCGFESIPHEWWHYNLKGWPHYPVIA